MRISKRIRYLIGVTAVAFSLVLLVRDPDTRLPSGSDTRANPEARAGISDLQGNDGAAPSTGAALPGDEVRREDGMPAAMHAQMADIATAYAENARYPDYAKPLNANDWNLLHPQALVPRQAALANAPGLSATVILDRYILDHNLDQPVQVQLTTEPGTGGSVSVNRVTVWLQQSGKRSAVLTLAGTGQSFQGVLPASSLRSVPPGETAVVAQLELSNGERSNVNAMVRLYEPEARLVRLGDTRVDGADLVIPASFEVSRPGHFRVAANLFNAAGNEPVSHLTAELALSPDNRSGLLKVHAVTLRAKQAAGPYVLKDFDITRMPDAPGDLTGFGSAAVESFAVRGFPLDSYSHEPYQDPEAEEKLAFLKKLAAGK